MVDCGFNKKERDIESRHLGLLWKSLHGAPLLRQILNDQEPQEWPMFAASFQANFHVKFWDLVRHLEEDDEASMDHSATSSFQGEPEGDSAAKEPVYAAPPGGQPQHQEMAESEILEDDPPVEVEVLNSDEDIFYA